MLEEYSQAELKKANKDPIFADGKEVDALGNPKTHREGSAFEGEVVSELLKRPATSREGGDKIEGVDQTNFRYGNFRYDVKFNSVVTSGQVKVYYNVNTIKLVETPQ